MATAPGSETLRSRAGRPVHFVVPAAGAGTRFGGALPKQFRELSGRPLLAWTIGRILKAGAESVVLALPDSSIDSTAGWFAGDPRLRCVAGGATRQASVALALAASPAAADDLVAVHDGARPALAFDDLVAVCAAAGAASVDGAVLGRQLADTLKRVVDGRIITTVERGQLFRAETPQVFRRATLERAIAAAAEGRFVGTDESSLVERLPGARVIAVQATQANPKVTTPSDLLLIESLFATAPDGEAAGEWR